MMFWGGRISVLVAVGVFHEMRNWWGPLEVLRDIKKILSQMVGALLFT